MARPQPYNVVLNRAIQPPFSAFTQQEKELEQLLQWESKQKRVQVHTGVNVVL